MNINVTDRQFNSKDEAKRAQLIDELSLRFNSNLEKMEKNGGISLEKAKIQLC